jgi:hypothetical protein
VARRALERWGPAAEDEATAWQVLADAHQLLGNDGQAAKFQELAQRFRLRPRGPGMEPPSPEEALEEAIDRRDHRTVAATLRDHGAGLGLRARVAGLRALGRDEEAWALLETAGLTRAKGEPSGDAAVLVTDVRDMREDHLHGASVAGVLDTLGTLEVRSLDARLELRYRAFTFGVEGRMDQLRTVPGSPLLAMGENEQHLRLVGKLRERIGQTVVRVGGHWLPTGFVPQASVAQLVSIARPVIELRAEGTVNALPSNTALLRAAAFRHGAEAEVVVGLPFRLEVSAAGLVNRFTSRYNELLTQEAALRGELAMRIPIGSAFFRPRVDTFHDWAAAVDQLIPGIAPFLEADQRLLDLLPQDYTTAGGGFTLGSRFGDVGEGRGPRLSLRYRLDAWAGQLFPAGKTTFAVEGALGLVFAHHQELAVSGFYYADRGGERGQQFTGTSARYTVRWF